MTASTCERVLRSELHFEDDPAAPSSARWLHSAKILEAVESVDTLAVLVSSATDTSWGFEPIHSPKDPSRRWGIGFDSSTGEVVTVYGVEGGKFQISRKKVETNASGRTVEHQALVVVRGLMRKKITKDAYVVACQSTTVSPPGGGGGGGLPLSLPPPILPMLATTFVLDDPEAPEPFWIEPKLDGIRCMVDRVDGHFAPLPSSPASSMRFRMTSRGRKSFDNLLPLFQRDLENLFEALSAETETASSAVVVDGELMLEGGDFQDTTSAVRTVKCISEAATERLRFHVFGLYLRRQPDTPFHALLEILRRAFRRASVAPVAPVVPAPSAISSTRIVLVDGVMGRTRDEIVATHNRYVAQGYEGAMLYSPSFPYQPGKRSKGIQKFKMFDELEGTVVSVCAGTGRESAAAQVVLEFPRGGIPGAERIRVKMHPEGSIARREEWLRNPLLVVGKQMTFTCQKFTQSGIPRFPIAKEIRDYE